MREREEWVSGLFFSSDSSFGDLSRGVSFVVVLRVSIACLLVCTLLCAAQRFRSFPFLRFPLPWHEFDMGQGESTEQGGGLLTPQDAQYYDQQYATAGAAAAFQQQQAFHVLRVADNSPASQAGVDPFFDFVVGVNGQRLVCLRFREDGSETRALTDQPCLSLCLS